jgi:hypothetical protein
MDTPHPLRSGHTQLKLPVKVSSSQLLPVYSNPVLGTMLIRDARQNLPPLNPAFANANDAGILVSVPVSWYSYDAHLRRKARGLSPRFLRVPCTGVPVTS